MTPLKDKEIVLSSSGKGGVKVKRQSYVAEKGPNAGKTVESVALDVGRAGQFQFVEVHHQVQGTTSLPPQVNSTAIRPPVDTKVVPPNNNGLKPVFGATAGLGVNNARLECEAAGIEPTEEKLWQLASKYARVSLRVESGDLYMAPAIQVPKAVESPDEPAF
jgi:hypothetical protein